MPNVWISGPALAVGILFGGSIAWSAEPPPQYTAEDLAKTFADKPQASGDECEKKDMVTGDDGVCEPKKDERGFSLPTRASRGAQQPEAAPVAKPARLATVGAAPAAARHHDHAPASRDLLITFKLGSADLTDQGRANAKVFAQALSLPELAGTHFELNGYTDASGDKDKNLALSQKRADAVKEYLVSQGVDGGRLSTHGYGAVDFALPSRPNSPENRRVVASKLE